VVKGCKPETLTDFRASAIYVLPVFRAIVAIIGWVDSSRKGFSPEGARQKIGMAVEGIYSCVSARELGAKYHIPVPITDATYAVIFRGWIRAKRSNFF